MAEERTYDQEGGESIDAMSAATDRLILARELPTRTVALVLAGVATLLVQRTAWDRMTRRGGGRRGLLPRARIEGR